MAEWIALKAMAVRPAHGRPYALQGGALLDHAAFRSRAAAWRAAFSARSGQCFALYMEDATEFAAALFGAWHAGKTVLSCADALDDTCARLGARVDGFAGEFPPGCVPMARGTAVDDGGDWPELDEAATRLVVYTSGSTGEPVAIDKCLAQLAREIEALESAFGAGIGEAHVHGTVSHQHIYGLLFRVLWPLAAGRAIAPRQFFHEEIAASIDAPAVLVTSPAHLKRIPDAVDYRQARARLRAVFSSGGALSAQASLGAAERLGQAPIEILGSSETGGIASRTSPAEAWAPLPGVRWRIADGLLEVASPHLPTAAWWRSADRAETVEEGGFRLLGRADRIVKVEERRVSLQALEHGLAAMPEVVEARVLVHEGLRTELAAVVVLSPAGTALLQADGRRALVRRLSGTLAAAHDPVTRPRRWRFVAALPVDAQGKTRDAALRMLFRPERPQPSWQVREPLHARLELELDPALAVFDGHFPQLPVLPGVAQLDWAIRFGREAFLLPPRFVRMEALKFQKIARPGLSLQLELEWLPDRSALAFRYTSALGPHASGRVVFEGEAA